MAFTIAAQPDKTTTDAARLFRYFLSSLKATPTIDGEVVELARFYPSLDGKESNLFPIVAQTGEAAG